MQTMKLSLAILDNYKKTQSKKIKTPLTQGKENSNSRALW